MKKLLAFLVVLLFVLTSYAQVPESIFSKNRTTDGDKTLVIKDSIEVGRSKSISNKSIKDYTYKFLNTQKLSIDTSMSIKTLYEQNFLQRDYFGYLTHSNIGMVLNPLIYEKTRFIIPKIGYAGKQFNLWNHKNIRYFDVKSPLTEIRYTKGMNQGQALSTLFTYSPSKSFNISFRYYGLRSLGRYLEQLSSTQKFLVTLNFKSSNGRYFAYTHYTSQNIDNEENGGLLNPQVEFESGNPRYKNRKSLSLRLSGVTTQFDIRRWFFQNEYKLLNQKKDSSSDKSGLFLGYSYTRETNGHIYEEDKTNSIYDDFTKTIANKDRFSEVKYDKKSHDVWIRTNSYKDRIYFKLGISNNFISHGYDSILQLQNRSIRNKLEDNLMVLHAEVNFIPFSNLNLDANMSKVISAKIFTEGYEFNANANYTLFNKYVFYGGILSSTTYPNLNFWLHQTFYDDFSFDNSLKSTKEKTLKVGVKNNDYGMIQLNYTKISDLTFLSSEYKLEQLENEVSFLKINLSNDIALFTKKIGKFSWQFRFDNSFIYQVSEDIQKAYPLPKFVIRNSIYAQGFMFKKNLFAQIGITNTYFSKFFSREYFPVLGEFKLQKKYEIGAYPHLDFFIQGKVKRFRFMLKVQNFTSEFTGYNFYSSPRNPNIDWIIRVGVIWYLNT